jgi:hypothetical protein
MHALGEPGKGIHRYRLFHLAIVDVLFTIIAGYFLSLITPYSFWLCTLLLFLLGIVAHRSFGVSTTLDKLLFGQ